VARGELSERPRDLEAGVQRRRQARRKVMDAALGRYRPPVSAARTRGHSRAEARPTYEDRLTRRWTWSQTESFHSTTISVASGRSAPRAGSLFPPGRMRKRRSARSRVTRRAHGCRFSRLVRDEANSWCSPGGAVAPRLSRGTLSFEASSCGCTPAGGASAAPGRWS
jgi:hypothetical protein